MRRGRLLVAGLGAAMLATGMAGASAGEEEISTEGLLSLESAGDGATVIVTGWLTREKFELKDVQISASRLAGSSTDPDQFRATMIDTSGRELGVLKMWSPLVTLEWDMERLQENARSLDDRTVQIRIPASLTLNEVVLSWPDGKYEVARVSVGDAIASFCKQMPANPACGKPLKPKG